MVKSDGVICLPWDLVIEGLEEGQDQKKENILHLTMYWFIKFIIELRIDDIFDYDIEYINIIYSAFSVSITLLICPTGRSQF